MAEPVLEEKPTLPTLYYHCVKAYKIMLGEAERDSDTGVVVYEGFLVKLLTSKMDLSNPYYSHITKCLKQMECIRLVRRGGGISPSVWHLKRSPTEELFIGLVPNKDQTSSARVAESRDRYAAVIKQASTFTKEISDLKERVEKLERIVIKLAQTEDE